MKNAKKLTVALFMAFLFVPETGEYNVLISKIFTYDEPYMIECAISWLIDSIDLP